MFLIYQQFLDQISVMRKELGLSIQPGCSDKELVELQSQARTELGVEIPLGYTQFLRQHNGFNWNGLFIYASKTVPFAGHKDEFIRGFVEMNQWLRDGDEWMEGFVLFGSSSLDFYVYESRVRKYSARDRVSFDEFESYSSFEEMIAEALRKHM